VNCSDGISVELIIADVISGISLENPSKLSAGVA
jgi:hypothetical protein